MHNRDLDCLYGPLDEIDAALEAFADSPDELREMSLTEIAALIKFEQKMRETCDSLKRLIRLTESQEAPPEHSVGRIDSLEHPVIQKIFRRNKEALDRAARIRRQNIRKV